jgi:hypothetical protein
MFKNTEIETPNSQSSFSFLAPRYKDFNNDVTFSEGDSFFGTLNGFFFRSINMGLLLTY